MNKHNKHYTRGPQNIILPSALRMNTECEKKKVEMKSPQTLPPAQAHQLLPMSQGQQEQGIVKALLKTGLSGFTPDAEGLTYKTMTFKADNTFQVDAALTAMDEEIECTESGKWTMDAAESKTTASMNWSITSSDCPTRSTPIELRVKVLIDKNEVHFR